MLSVASTLSQCTPPAYSKQEIPGNDYLRAESQSVVNLPYRLCALRSGSLVERSKNEVRGCWSNDVLGGHSSDPRDQWYAVQLI